MKWRDRYKQLLVTRFASIETGHAHTLPGRLVVSLTSEPAQFRALSLTVRSLLAQDVSPDLLVLWVAYDDFEALPRSVTRLQYDGLVIRQCANLRRYNAIIPALETFPRAFVVTAGEDAYYPPDWLRRLTAAYQDPREILCRAARCAIARGGLFAPFAEWESVAIDGETGPHVFFTAFGGVLFPPGSLAPQVTDEDAFQGLCPESPDVWLNWMAFLAGSSIRVVEPIELMIWPDPLGLPRREESGGDDDRAIAAMLHAYGHPQSAQHVA